MFFNGAEPFEKLARDIIQTNVPTKFHKLKITHLERTIPPHGGHVFQLTGTIFELNWAINMTFRVLKLDKDIIIINLWTKFHEDQTKNVASRLLTRQNVDDARRTTDDGRRTTDKR
ncbi:hypothetical protein DPMN_073415 [Dreissena polymorpha]|uniref:Uncharacterized protein n=1 Tax=Dreissena polymorpha TaxID=45954 RepID=A0A9D4BZ39_DREPO|nr:hypothetical protein DPMN_073415 [Dreissena polymorpha]